MCQRDEAVRARGMPGMAVNAAVSLLLALTQHRLQRGMAAAGLQPVPADEGAGGADAGGARARVVLPDRYGVCA